MKYVALLATLALFVFAPRSARAQGPEYVPGDILVMLTEGADPATVATELATVKGVPTSLRVVQQVSAPMRTWLFHFDEGRIAQEVMLRAMRSHPAVQIAQNNHIIKERVVPNDPQFGQQWHHQNINSETAWDISTGGVTATGDTIVVCIIERADLPHPDLIANAWYNHAEIPNNGIDDDGNGYVDDFRGWNTPNNNDNVYGGGHGTQVAGMIGAKGNNSLGVVGANWNVKMMAVNYGNTQEAQVVAAYTYPWIMRRRYNQSNGTQGAFVVATNASWGVDNGNPANAPLWCAVYDSLGAVGILSCGATANNNVNVDVVGDLPTACGSDYLISVTATNQNDMRTFSGYGLTTIDVGAPGDNVRTTNQGGGYGTTSGTSFASPLTAGVIGLLYSAPCTSLMSLVHADPAAGAMYVRQALFDGVDHVGNLAGQTVTGGRINAGNSMALIMQGCGSCPAAYNLAATSSAIGTAELSWTSSLGDTFDVRYRVVGTPDWTEVTGLTTTQIDLSDLQACAQYEFQVRTHCGEEAGEYGASFIWTSEGCCTVPLEVSPSGAGETQVTVAWTAVLAAASYDLRYAEQGSTNWTTVSGINGTQQLITGLEACTGYQVQVRSLCGGSLSDWSASALYQTTGCGACMDLTYCTSSGGTEDEWIRNVTLGTINNESGNNGGYGDFTGMSTTLNIGQTYPISLRPGFAFFPYGEYFTAYMDLDHDGQFTANEKVFDAGQTVTGTLNGTLTVPANAPIGIVRLRVVMQYDEPVANGCVTMFEYGEVEDYCVNLVSTVGVSEVVPGIGLTVFPDPADRDIFFTMTNAPAGRLTVQVLDATGRQVALKAMESGRATITTAWYSEGFYAYRVLNGTEELARGRFIVVHP
jgi:serine protease